MTFSIGDLVQSETDFSGIGKLVSLDEAIGIGTVAFFESPVRSCFRPIEVPLSHLQTAVIFDEANVFCVDKESGIWRRARYASQRPDGTHFILFKRDDTTLVSISDLHILNLDANSSLDPLEFLEARYTDTPFFTDWRIPFMRSYLEQRAACRSISSILSSSVEIEPHQVAVVRRVLQDKVKKYLLADEVGLGKTIEACLIIREHVLQDEESAFVIIAVPEGLVNQWRSELVERFYLGDLLDTQIFICSHEKFVGALEIEKPTMIVVDEAHQVTPWAWSGDLVKRNGFKSIAAECACTEVCLLLSGTPLSGNEMNFLAMLHLLSPDSYQLSENGKQDFLKLLEERERLGGMYQALLPSNDNDTLTEIVEKLVALFPNDSELQKLADSAKPLIDWLASEEGEERTNVIDSLRTHIGENYRLHQRMLRNRREDKGIAALFPGLSGAREEHWNVGEHFLSIDQALDAFRDEYIGTENRSEVLNCSNFVEWVELYFTSPSLVSERAKQLLSSCRSELEDYEVELLEYLEEGGAVEQISKDQKLLEILTLLFKDREEGRVVVFCGHRDLADHVFDLLEGEFKDFVERHQPDVTPRFSIEKRIRVLVCDERGEDGLNLHGGEKILIHYGLPMSFARIEQRNGRVNRYSASIFATPISSVVLIPDRKGYFKYWVDVLNRTVRIFDQSVASLQYVLQDRIDNTWQRVITEGLQPLKNLNSELAGPDGLLEIERRKINAQEELNSMNEEVARAVSFANLLEAADEVAEKQADRMFKWIRKGLKFGQKPGEIDGSFRFSYNNDGARGPRTLVDVMSFIENCITGIDKENSDWSAPVTSLMSPDRQLASHGQQVYPMRYGQPFVDTINKLSRSDTRGICSARLRAVGGLNINEPKLFLKFFWVVSHCEPGCSLSDRRIADEKFPPRLYSRWHDENGGLVSDETIRRILDARYSKNPTRAQRFSYQDININHQTWSHLEEYFPESSWAQLVRKIGAISFENLKSKVNEVSSFDTTSLHSRLEAITAVILIKG